MSPRDSSPSEEPEPTVAKLKRLLPTMAEWERDTLPETHECTSDKCARVMFSMAVTTLFLLGLMIDHGISGDARAAIDGPWFTVPLVILWFVIILEGLVGMAMTHDHHWDAFKRFLLVTVCPPFRAAFASAYPSGFVWLPQLGWIQVNKLNFERAEMRFALPMLGVTLLVLPLLGVELLFDEWLKTHAWAAAIVHILTAVVWFGFTLEFIVMLALTDKKLAYCKQHWVNLAIILLPLFAFVRLIRLLGFGGKATKILRAYRMRGIVTRTMRFAMVFNLIERLMERNPEKYLSSLEDKVLDKQAEIQAMHEKMDELRERIAKEKAEKEADAHQEAAS